MDPKETLTSNEPVNLEEVMAPWLSAKRLLSGGLLAMVDAAVAGLDQKLTSTYTAAAGRDEGRNRHVQSDVGRAVYRETLAPGRLRRADELSAVECTREVLILQTESDTEMALVLLAAGIVSIKCLFEDQARLLEQMTEKIGRLTRLVDLHQSKIESLAIASGMAVN